MGAEYFVRQVARRLDVPVGEVGTAGLKDRHAVTRQMVSVPVRAEGRLPQLDGDGIRLLSVSRHGNKLKPGHLHGNRFRILVRDVNPAADETLPVLDRLRRQGMPNFYGPQRFGHDGETVLMGMALLRGEPFPAAAIAVPPQAGAVGGAGGAVQPLPGAAHGRRPAAPRPARRRDGEMAVRRHVRRRGRRRGNRSGSTPAKP